MEQSKFKTISQLIDEFGCSKSTFYRRLGKAGVATPKGLVSPKVENMIRSALGFPELSFRESLWDKMGREEAI